MQYHQPQSEYQTLKWIKNNINSFSNKLLVVKQDQKKEILVILIQSKKDHGIFVIMIFIVLDMHIQQYKLEKIRIIKFKLKLIHKNLNNKGIDSKIKRNRISIPYSWKMDKGKRWFLKYKKIQPKINRKYGHLQEFKL